MKTNNESQTDEAARAMEAAERAITDLVVATRERLGAERLAKLERQPACIGNGGMDAVLRAAAAETVGHPVPVISAGCRALQLCGVKPSEADLS